ncbi:hypothetical protein MUO14_21490 [Halobacillus shinanisalinarum]|uniref:Lipoprotein n=1 Tax=Halobacillus shinanisalinarum TaxID=2932258 RepID=A0ABY4GYF8_9BACI|nr:hypothetical protein [Halobacillus shinanisalinarum]UOQ92943.1 hypothetical protein MUO14_21490 [Halobacillus shinanisalinarum]
MRNQVLTFIILSGILFLIAGCSSSASKDENIAHIEVVLEEVFTGPNGELAAIYKELESASMEIIKSASKDFRMYYEENLKSYFTEQYYTKFINTNKASTFHGTAYRNGYRMKVKDMNIEQNASSETAYDFSVNIGYKKEGNAGKSAEITGRVNVNEDGKITRVLYHNGGELFE